MNWTNKKGSRPIVQLKSTAPAPGIRRPVAPPVYKPQPVPKVLQRKTSLGQNPHQAQPAHRPVAPPVYRPQAKPVIAQAKTAANSQPVKHPVVQRYKAETIPNMGGLGKLSENEHYFIPNANKKLIYVEAKSAHEPHISKDTTAALQTYNSKQYKTFKPIGQYYQDCLHTAEEIMAGGDLDFKSSDRSRVAGTQRKAGLFGQKPSKNIKLAQRYHKQFDNAADPYVGQAYAIVNKKWKDRRHRDPGLGRYPFHAAAVVARDGKDRITLEVYAGEDEAKGRNTDGEYYMYEAGATATQGRTFHEVQSATGDFSAGPYTLVIEPK